MGSPPRYTPDSGAPFDDEGPLSDDRLRLIFTCCHPALAREAQVALTLRLVAGLTVEEIARGLLKTEAAVGQRITRAKAKIASAHIPYRVPAEDELPERLDTVLSVVYLVFNEGYLPGGDQPLRPELSGEAIRLTRLLCSLLPDAEEATGLLALMLMTEARRMSRISADGELVPLAEQDRGAWDRRADRRGPRPCARADRRWRSAGPLSAAGGDQRGAHRMPVTSATPTGSSWARSMTSFTR